MMSGILADRSIRFYAEIGHLLIDPFNPRNVQPSSYDLTLGGDEPLSLSPGAFHLARTAEWNELPASIQGRYQGQLEATESRFEHDG